MTAIATNQPKSQLVHMFPGSSWDGKAQRLAVTGYNEHRLFMLKLDQRTGSLIMDTAFHDADGKPGFNFDDRQWPRGWTGSANPHGVVFSR